MHEGMEYKLVKFDSNTGYCTWEDGENRRVHETNGAFMLQFGNQHVERWEGDGAAQMRVSGSSGSDPPVRRAGSRADPPRSTIKPMVLDPGRKPTTGRDLREPATLTADGRDRGQQVGGQLGRLLRLRSPQ